MASASRLLAPLLVAAIGCAESTTAPDGGIDAGHMDAGRLDGGSDASGTVCDETCDKGRSCCDGECVNLANDPRHCGVCGHTCIDEQYCTGRSCIDRPCTTTCDGDETCCAGTCCAPGQICCDPQGPIEMGPVCTEPSETGTCPTGCAPLCQCASPDTAIATPDGERSIASLVPGDLVYSLDGDAIRAVPIAAIARTPVHGHHVFRVALATGAILEISPGHPTADGRAFADLRAGGELDGTLIVAIDLVPYEHPFTYDILPASDTGYYYAGGVLVGSTLAGGRR